MKRRKFMSALALIPFIGPMLVKAAVIKPEVPDVLVELKLVEENGFCLMELWSDQWHPGAELQLLSYSEFLPTTPQDMTITGRIVINQPVWVKHMGTWSMCPKPANVLTVDSRESFETPWANVSKAAYGRTPRSQIIQRTPA